MRAFASIKAAWPEELGSFEDAPALVAHLNRAGAGAADLDAKDLIIDRLVRTAAHSHFPELAIALLLLGLWPGLSMMFGRLLRLYEMRPTELAAEILALFPVCVRRLDVGRCNRPAATLVRNTERVVLYQRQLEMRCAEAGEYSVPDTTEVADPAADEAAGFVELRASLESILARRDVELLFAVYLAGQNCHQAGDAIGISHSNARQRLARAVAKIRPLLGESAVTGRRTATAFPGR